MYREGDRFCQFLQDGKTVMFQSLRLFQTSKNYRVKSANFLSKFSLGMI